MYIRLDVPIHIVLWLRGWSSVASHKDIDPRRHGRERSLDYLFLQTCSIVKKNAPIVEHVIPGRYVQGPRILTPSRELPTAGVAINAGQPRSTSGSRDSHTRPITNARHRRDFRVSGVKFTCAREVKHERSICV